MHIFFTLFGILYETTNLEKKQQMPFLDQKHLETRKNKDVFTDPKKSRFLSNTQMYVTLILCFDSVYLRVSSPVSHHHAPKGTRLKLQQQRCPWCWSPRYRTRTSLRLISLIALCLLHCWGGLTGRRGPCFNQISEILTLSGQSTLPMWPPPCVDCINNNRCHLRQTNVQVHSDANWDIINALANYLWGRQGSCLFSCLPRYLNRWWSWQFGFG